MELPLRDDLRPRVLAALTPVWIQPVFLLGMVITLATGWVVVGILVSVSCVVGVLVAGRRFTQSEQMPEAVRASMNVTVASALVGWSWQYFAAITTTTAPHHFFPAFSPPDTAIAMTYVFTYPYRILALVFLICCAAAVIAAWRGGARLSLPLLVLWWCGVFFLFAVPTIAAWGFAAAGPE